MQSRFYEGLRSNPTRAWYDWIDNGAANPAPIFVAMKGERHEGHGSEKKGYKIVNGLVWGQQGRCTKFNLF